ncbi:hypothetical protein [Aliiglaciecola sp. LCG003]|nr:hypothetical protein [Aliiglaciecola sp. LCG003]WJG09401.1 hypothetical protein QR722_19060 [Aliiglaciecola sp. LCG003]
MMQRQNSLVLSTELKFDNAGGATLNGELFTGGVIFTKNGILVDKLSYI